MRPSWRWESCLALAAAWPWRWPTGACGCTAARTASRTSQVSLDDDGPCGGAAVWRAVWIHGSNRPTALKAYSGAALLVRTRFEGWGDGGGGVADLWVLEPVALAWSRVHTVGPAPAQRRSHSLLPVGTHSLLLFGTWAHRRPLLRAWDDAHASPLSPLLQGFFGRRVPIQLTIERGGTSVPLARSGVVCRASYSTAHVLARRRVRRREVPERLLRAGPTHTHVARVAATGAAAHSPVHALPVRGGPQRISIVRWRAQGPGAG